MTDLQTNGSPAAEATRIEPHFTPATDIIENGTGVLMVLDMPGPDPNSLDVTLDNRVLRISANPESSAPDGYTLIHAEYRDCRYERSFAISDPIDGASIEAVFKDGVLRLTLPKAALAPAARVAVKAE